MKMPKTLDDLVEHRGLVTSVIHAHYRWAVNSRIDFEDLIQQGFLGMAHALRRHDGKHAWTTYAWPWIRAYVGRYVSTQWCGMSVPANAILCRTYSRNRDVQRRLDLAKNVESLSRCIRIRNAGDIPRWVEAAETLVDPAESATSRVDEQDEASHFASYCRQRLTDRQREILRRRCVEDQSLSEVGQAVGSVSRQRVEQLQKKAVEKVRKWADRPMPKDAAPPTEKTPTVWRVVGFQPDGALVCESNQGERRRYLPESGVGSCSVKR